MKYEIIPAIMPKSFEDLRNHVVSVIGSTHIVQLDIMDGIFVPPTTWPFFDNKEKYWDRLQIGQTKLPEHGRIDYELDLMVDTPEDEIFDWVKLGPKRLIFHIESIRDFSLLLQEMDRIPREIEIGFAINNDTPFEHVAPYVVHADFIQLMGIERVGYQGQGFDERVLSRAQFIKDRYPDLIVSVDGAVNKDTLSRLQEVGVDRFVAGSAVYGGDDPRAAINSLVQLAELGSM